MVLQLHYFVQMPSFWETTIRQMPKELKFCTQDKMSACSNLRKQKYSWRKRTLVAQMWLCKFSKFMNVHACDFLYYLIWHDSIAGI